MSDKIRLTTLLHRAKANFDNSKSNLKFSFISREKAQTPNKKLCISPSRKPNSTRAPIDINCDVPIINKPINTSRNAYHQLNKHSAIHSQSIAIKKKPFKDIFTIINKKTDNKKQITRNKESIDSQTIHVNSKNSFNYNTTTTMTNNKQHLDNMGIPLKIKKKNNVVIDRNKKWNNSLGNSMSFVSSSINNYITKLIIKKVEENQRKKEKLLWKVRSISNPKEDKFEGNNKVIMNNGDDKANIQKNSFSSKAPTSLTHSYLSNSASFNNKKGNNINIIKSKNNTSNNNNTSNSNNTKYTFKEINKSPLMRTKAQNKQSIKKNKTKKSSSPKLTISRNLNHIISMSNTTKYIKNNNTTLHSSTQSKKKNIIKEYPNRVNLVNLNNIKNIYIPCENKRIKGRKIAKIDSVSKKGFSGKGMTKINQDGYSIFKNLNNEDNCIFFMVCDGHGINGHIVKDYLITTLPNALNKSFESHQIKSISSSPIETINSIITETFFKVNTNLILTDKIDSTFSGSTCVSLIYTPNFLICANVGDSRCVVGKLTQSGEWKAEKLSNDHKPSNKEEMKRILLSGGRVESFKNVKGNYIGPERVWVKDDDVPGLAMSRSFGDDVAQSVGVIPKPEIIDMELKEEDKFAILASDGIWGFISNEECVNIIKDYYVNKDTLGAMEHLCREATKRWLREEEAIDDITAIVIFFE